MMQISVRNRTRYAAHRALLAYVLATLTLAGCASHSARSGAAAAAAAAGPGKLTPQMRSGSAELRAWQIQDWIAPDDRTLVVNAVDRSLFRARFKGRCNGVRLADTVSFIVVDSSRFDRYAGIVLTDGTRCEFASVTRINTGVASQDQ
jgi:hypothetical protein